MASLHSSAPGWAAPQRTNDWVLDSTCGKTLGELSRLAQSLPATILPKPIARPLFDSAVESVGLFLKNGILFTASRIHQSKTTIYKLVAREGI